MQFFKNKPIYINLTKTYKATMYVLVAVLLMVQLALTTPGARAVLTFTDKFEGVMKSDSDKSSLGEITLSLVDLEPVSDIEILQNGQPIAMFYDKEIKITVSDNSVIEIDGRRVKTPFAVEISGVSSNIEIEGKTTYVNVNSNISLIGRVFIK